MIKIHHISIVCSVILLVLLGNVRGFAVQKDSSIIRMADPDGWLIKTKSSAYRINITKDQKVFPVYYGTKSYVDYHQSNLRVSRIEEVPVRGGAADKTNVLEVIYQDRKQTTNLKYISSRVIQVKGHPTLEIIQKDRLHPLKVVSYIRVLSEYNILEKWMTVKNTGKLNNIQIQNLLSGSIILPSDQYVLNQLSGSQLGEFQPYISDITPGIKTIENRAFKSNRNMPWFMIRPKRVKSLREGSAWWGEIHYSGNWKLIFDYAYSRKEDYTLQIAGGINFQNTVWILKPGESFTTPKISFGYTNEGAEGASRYNAAYVRNEILPEEHRHQLRPVIFNSWMTTTYHINNSLELEMAKVASDLRVELFVVDDGWYKGRVDSKSGLGDWEVDKNKFPNGLKPLIDSVHTWGMKFGLWVEPESISPKSDVYKSHPNWVLGNYTKGELPDRVFLNLAREDVFQHLFHVLDQLLAKNKIDFIKWDQNTYLTENVSWPGAAPGEQQEVRIRFIQNVYRLVDTLKERHPNVMFESCASGGGRVDLGMLSRMDLTTPSDNTMSVDRLFIQYSYLGARPANTMESWLIGNWQYQQDNQPSLSFKFDVAMSGLLGISAPILKWTPEEKAIAKKKIKLYKEIRSIVQQGNLYRLASPFNHNRCALQYNSPIGDSAVVFCYNLAQYVTARPGENSIFTGGAQFLDQGSTILKLRGLNANKDYFISIAGDEENTGKVYSGDYLMNVGMAWPTKKPFDSRILSIKQIGK